MAENKKIDLNKFYKDLGISEQASNNTASKEKQIKTIESDYEAWRQENL